MFRFTFVAFLRHRPGFTNPPSKALGKVWVVYSIFIAYPYFYLPDSHSTVWVFLIFIYNRILSRDSIGWIFVVSCFLQIQENWLEAVQTTRR